MEKVNTILRWERSGIGAVVVMEREFTDENKMIIIMILINFYNFFNLKLVNICR